MLSHNHFQVSSYGGYLEFTLRYVPTPGNEEQSDGEALVEINVRHTTNLSQIWKSNPYCYQGNDIRFLHYSEAVGQSEKGHHYKVLLHESQWERVDRQGQKANREHMMMALADLDYILIKAAHSERTMESS